MRNAKKITASGIGLVLVLAVMLIPGPYAHASADDNSIPQVRVDGPDMVAPGSMLSITLQFDDDLPGDIVKAVQLDFVIVDICSEGTVDVQFDLQWDNPVLQPASNVIFQAPDDNRVIAVANAQTNLDSSNGLDIITVECLVIEGSEDLPVSVEFNAILAARADSAGNPVPIDVFPPPPPTPATGKGELTGDELINIFDGIRLARHIAGIELLPDPSFADISPAFGEEGNTVEGTCGNDMVNISDLVALLQAVVSGNPAQFIQDRCPVPP